MSASLLLVSNMHLQLQSLIAESVYYKDPLVLKTHLSSISSFAVTACRTIEKETFMDTVNEGISTELRL